MKNLLKILNNNPTYKNFLNFSFRRFFFDSLSNRSFTLIEVIIVIVIISFTLIGLITTISYGSTSVERIRKEVISINIAREGMEAVYNMRDTNWLRWSGKINKCWLKIDPMQEDGNGDCSDDLWISGYNYTLTGKFLSGQQYYSLIPNNSILNLKDNNKIIDNSDNQYIMCLSGSSWYNCPGSTGDIKEGRFFRMIRGEGLYNKFTNTKLNCTNGTSPGCGDNDAKEFRFCSVVEYQGSTMGNLELCGLIANFK